MKRMEVVEILEKIDIYYPGKVKVDNPKQRLDAFEEALRDADCETINKNLMKHIRSNDWPPSIAHLLKENSEIGRAIPSFEETMQYLKERDNRSAASDEVRKEEAAKVRAMLDVRTKVSD